MPRASNGNSRPFAQDRRKPYSSALLAELENQVNLLKAYRKSLIAEAVTGKIEVLADWRKANVRTKH